MASQQETEHYMSVLSRWHSREMQIHNFIHEILNGFDGDYSERVPDEFLERVYKYQGGDCQQHVIDRWVRTSCNTDPALRRLYAFWKAKCNGKITNRKIRPFMVIMAIDELYTKWYCEITHICHRLRWHDKECPVTIEQNNDDLTHYVKAFWYEPKRLERLTIDYIKGH
jgi:hypothetical protein